MSGIKIEKLVEEYQTAGFNKFKTDLADLTISVIEPIAKKTDEFLNNRDYVITVLRDGRTSAR